MILPFSDLCLLLSDPDFDDPLDDLLDDLDPPVAQKRNSLTDRVPGKKSDSPYASPSVTQKKVEKGKFSQISMLFCLFVFILFMFHLSVNRIRFFCLKNITSLGSKETRRADI